MVREVAKIGEVFVKAPWRDFMFYPGIFVHLPIMVGKDFIPPTFDLVALAKSVELGPEIVDGILLVRWPVSMVNEKINGQVLARCRIMQDGSVHKCTETGRLLIVFEELLHMVI